MIKYYIYGKAVYLAKFKQEKEKELMKVGDVINLVLPECWARVESISGTGGTYLYNFNEGDKIPQDIMTRDVYGIDTFNDKIYIFYI